MLEEYRVVRVAAGVASTVTYKSLWADPLMRPYLAQWRNTLDLSLGEVIHVIGKIRERRERGQEARPISSPLYFEDAMQEAHGAKAAESRRLVPVPTEASGGTPPRWRVRGVKEDAGNREPQPLEFAAGWWR